MNKRKFFKTSIFGLIAGFLPKFTIKSQASQDELKKKFGDLADIERLSDTSIYDWDQKRWVYPFAYLNK